MAKKSKQPGVNVAAQNVYLGRAGLPSMFRPLLYHSRIVREQGNLCPPNGWAVVTELGQIHLNPTRRAEPEQWTYVIAHCLLHLGFGHFHHHTNPEAWNAACDVFIAKFLDDMKLGMTPDTFPFEVDFPVRNEEQLYAFFCEHGVPDEARAYGLAGREPLDMVADPRKNKPHPASLPKWSDLLGQGLALAVARAVDIAGGLFESADDYDNKRTPAQLAKAWFISSYPLLGALAASFKIIEDAQLCVRLGISIAAVDAEAREIYMNPNAGLSEDECRFVMAHELLHVGLSHHTRCQGRDPYLWNVACDYVINCWLVEMRVGGMPRVGGMYDLALKDESAEAIYDRIVTDMRHYRKIASLRGTGVGDMLTNRIPDWWKTSDGLALDEFYRRCLAQGLDYHQCQGRGLLPIGLTEEINALSQPPIPWDVALAKWFDYYFAPLEKIRTYARPSRRQASTPDIPRPRWIPKPNAEDGRTFGVILDTSGSMERSVLAKALGTIASYSITHDVPAVRLVFCDAAPYDQGYVPPESIAERVTIKGRGGTVLQPGIDLLEQAEDFPIDGPLLIITDGECDRLRVARSHAFLLPEGHHLPFPPKGEVFRIS